MKKIVDPPSGWMYGFPKELPDNKLYEELLKEAGYPKQDIEFAMKYTRTWYENDKPE